MATIIDFARQVVEEFQAVQQAYANSTDGSLARLDLSPQAVAGLIQAAYDASMIPDEGRFPVARLMSYCGGDRAAFHFPLDPPRDASAVEIAKLAHGADAGSHLCIFCRDGAAALAGIHVTTLDELRQFGFASFRIGNPLRIVIRGPGHIEVSTGGTSLVFRAGEIKEEEPLLSSDVLTDLEAVLIEQFQDRTTGPIECLCDVFNELIKAIVRLGHGGLLLVLEAPDWDEFAACRRTDSRLLSNLLVRYFDEMEAAARAGGRPSELSDASGLCLSTTTAMLENCIRSVGQLSGMDGAIVMDTGCNVVAFNAIIRAKADNHPASLVDEIGRVLDDADVGKNRGSRHQSALSFARRVPCSFAFVISQDGGVTAFHNRGNGTVRYEGGLRVFD